MPLGHPDADVESAEIQVKIWMSAEKSRLGCKHGPRGPVEIALW